MSAPEADSLRVYVVFDNPHDLPGHIVVRAFLPQRDGRVLAEDRFVAWLIREDREAALEAARTWCAARGLMRLERHPGDDPKIVETWL